MNPPPWSGSWEPLHGPWRAKVRRDRPAPLVSTACSCWPAGVVPEPAIALPAWCKGWHWLLISTQDAWALHSNWYLTASGYPVRNHSNRQQYLYRLIGWLQHDPSRAPENLEQFYLPQTIHVDHKDRNTANNHRLNLRLVDGTLNNFNRAPPRESGLEGAHWDERRQLWQAKVKHQGKTRFLGRYGTEQQAHRVASVYKQRVITDHTKTFHKELADVPF
jgi:hypothetical protein